MESAHPRAPRDHASWGAALFQPVDAASLAAFRIGFGLLLAVGMLRFLAEGWVRVLFVEPTFFFKYYGFAWVDAPPPAVVYALYGALCLLALAFAAGLFFRAVAILLFLGFSWVELIDVTNYLNHYYLVSLLLFLSAFLPLGDTWSSDARRRPDRARQTVPAWVLYLLRFQVGVVYVFAGLAKLGSDWLLYAQPLGIWLAARDEMPLLGPFFATNWAPYLMSWAGFLFDSSIVLFLAWKRTRVFAFVVVLIFHTGTHLLFDIGLFPFLMPLAATLFFSPSWPRRVFARWVGPPPDGSTAQEESPVVWTPRRRLVALPVAAYVVLQVVLPLRSVAYGGDVLWHEQGMRWSWKVMVREKNGSIVYRVRNADTGREWQVGPMHYLTWRQANEMTGQPDLVLQLAQHIADDFEQRGLGPVEVRVDALVSLNGRPATRLIDPTVDLARVEDGLRPASWILPRGDAPPFEIVRRDDGMSTHP